MATDKINSLIDVKQVEKEIALTVDALDKILQKMTAITANAAKSGIIKNAKDFEQLAKASEEVNAVAEQQVALDKELAKAKEKIAQQAAKLIALQSAEAAEIERNNQLIREAQRELKNKIAADNAEQGSIAKKRAELNKLTAEYDKLNGEQLNNINIGGKMQAEIKQLTAELKVLEHQTGRDQRNVGNYAEALDVARMSLGELKRELRTLRNTPTAGLDPAQLAATEARMAELTDAVGDYSARIKTAGDKTQLMIEAGQGLIAVAQFGTATMSLFGIENEKLEKAMVQLIGVAQGLATIHQLNEKQVFKSAIAHAKLTAQKISLTIATYAQAQAEKSSTLAISGLWKVIAANPMTALLVGIVAVTAGIIALMNAMKPAKSTIEALGESQKEVFDTALQSVGKMEVYKSVILDTTRSEKERNDAIKKYNELAIEQGVNTVSLSMSTAELNAIMYENTKRIYAQAAATAAMNEMTAKFTELIKLRALQQKYADENIGLKSAIQKKIDETNEEINSLMALYRITNEYNEANNAGAKYTTNFANGIKNITDNSKKATKEVKETKKEIKSFVDFFEGDEELAIKVMVKPEPISDDDIKEILDSNQKLIDELSKQMSNEQFIPTIKDFVGRFLNQMSAGMFDKRSVDIIVNSIATVWQSAFQIAANADNANLEQFKENQDKRLKILDQALAQGNITQQMYDDKKRQLDNETEKRERLMARRAAVRERAQALFSIALSTAQAIMQIWKVYAANPILAGVLTGVVGAAGIAQTAAVVGTPLPAYAKGRKGGKGELAQVAEQGQEAIVHNGMITLTPKVPSVMWVPQGADVLTASETKQLLGDIGAYNRLDRIERAIKDKEYVGINITEKGMHYVVKRGNNTTNYINKIKN